jgi:cytochrome c
MLNFPKRLALLGVVGVAMTGVLMPVYAQTVDVAAAEKLLEDNKCGKCHSLDKAKDGPAYKKTAAKYKGKADGEAKLFTHMTTGPTVEIEGVKEEHTKIKSKDEAAIKNLARYILSR